MSTFNALMTALIDYAGLFPPAQLDMAAAARQYEHWLARPEAWIVGRFICPVARFDELQSAMDTSSLDQVQISALVGNDLSADLDRIGRLIGNTQERFDVPAIEMKISDVAQLEEALDILDPDDPPCTAFFEFPPGIDPRGMIAALAGTAHGAKIRTGGVRPDLFPSAPDVARFIAACRDAQVPFKATAGLHHPIRTPAPDIGVTMFGFLNVFLAAIAAAATDDLDTEHIQSILLRQGGDWFEFTDDVVKIDGLELTAEDIELARSAFAISFGSCSIAQPVEDLQRLNLLPAVKTT